jgi:hypothetical protein
MDRTMIIQSLKSALQKVIYTRLSDNKHIGDYEDFF